MSLAPATKARTELLAGLRGALTSQRGYAAGKLGNTERAFVRSTLVGERLEDARARHAFELALAHQALRHAGIFPAEPGFLREFCRRYCAALSGLDCVGLWPERWGSDLVLLDRIGFEGLAIGALEQEPDRSLEADEARCYLPFFRDRRLLLVSPFAELMRERATEPSFESVWQKTGKPWFHPAAVEAVELPYGFAPATWERYPTALELLAELLERIDRVPYDVAMIGAGGLGTPIASALKERGKVAISLGGHLQVLFGILGARWRDNVDFVRDYVNDAWIDMPERYRPGAGESAENYW